MSTSVSSSNVSEQKTAPRPVLSRIGFAMMTVCRYLLGLGMVPYAWSKLQDRQFQVQASFYALPLAQISGRKLTWAWLGFSPTFQILMGVLEFVPALLLFWSRTRRLGALIVFPVLLNVVLINFFYDLWPSTQIISTVLLALNLFLILYDFRIYLRFFDVLIARPDPIANPRLRMAARVVSIAIPTAFIGWWITDFSKTTAELDSTNDFIGARQINGAGTWKIESSSIGDVPMAGMVGNTLYFDFSHSCVYSDGTHLTNGEFKANRLKKSFEISDISFSSGKTAKNPDVLQGTYQTSGETLTLNGQQGAVNVLIVLRRGQWGPVLPGWMPR